MTGIGLAGASSIPGAPSTTLRPGRPGVYRVNTASNDVVGVAVHSADEDMLEQLHTLLGTGGHIVSAHALLRAFYSRSLFGFPASATQLRSSAGLDCHAVLIELLGGDVQPARPHHGEPIGPGGSELGGVGELLENAVSDDFGHVIGTAAAVVKLKIERCVIYRPRLADVVFHG